uniref:Uncharacterized protein n=1 Tax=Thermogemmatispora argillosa TaxID=2045280 RepID=A0A455T8R8_9CHLR|nr:hypothetical protein KTA_40390 [Thermogemmatispora argillosa]
MSLDGREYAIAGKSVEPIAAGCQQKALLACQEGTDSELTVPDREPDPNETTFLKRGNTTVTSSINTASPRALPNNRRRVRASSHQRNQKSGPREAPGRGISRG